MNGILQSDIRIKYNNKLTITFLIRLLRSQGQHWKIFSKNSQPFEKKLWRPPEGGELFDSLTLKMLLLITGLWMCKFERLPWRTRRETVVDFLGLEPTRISTNKPQTLETGPSLDTGLSGNNTKNKEGQTVLHINRSKYSGLWLTRPVWAREHWRISPPRSWPSVKKATEPG